MTNKLLEVFYRSNNLENSADFGEKIGNVGLGLLRIGFGKTLIVKESASGSGKIAFKEKMYSTTARVTAVALFVIALPLTLLLAGIGCIGMACSKSHKQILNVYNQPNISKRKPVEPNKKHVRFGSVQVRVFNKDEPPAQVGKIQSTELKDKNTLGPQVRKTPPLGINDTIVWTATGNKSVHGSGEIFSDNEIVEKLDIIERVKIEDDVYAAYTKYGKAIIQQQATRSCTAAAAAMLILDNGKKPNVDLLKTRNVGSEEDVKRDIQDAGLRAVAHSANDLLKLRELIQKNGSAIAYVIEGIGGHLIVVDNVSEDLSAIRLRDPYHGWEITVSKDAFLREWESEQKVIQVV